jgi:hypothetical protein
MAGDSQGFGVIQRAWMSQLVKYLDSIGQIHHMSKCFIPVQYICSMESLLLGILGRRCQTPTCVEESV